MGEELELSFGKQVAKRSWIAAWAPFGSWRTDSALAAVGLIITGFQAWQTYGWPSDFGAAVRYLVTFAAPFAIVWFVLFVWHLWLAPAALAYETAKARTTIVRPPKSSRLADGTTVAMAGLVRRFCENARRPNFEWPPRDMEFGYSAHNMVFESSHPIWTNAEINVLRRRLNSLFLEMSGLWKAHERKSPLSDEEKENLKKCAAAIDEVGQELSHRLIDG